MISPKLEKLIWEGKAFYKTYVAGPQKSTLNIDNDRFIIITDINFSGYTNTAFNMPNIQLNVYGEKGFNHYLFRTTKAYQGIYYDSATSELKFVNNLTIATEPQKIDTYLIHTTQVGFSFIEGLAFTAPLIAVASESNPSLQPPLDYGKNGDTGAIPVTVSATTGGTMLNFFTNRLAYTLPDGSVTTQQIQYPASAARLPQASELYCFANINYIEILGQPENMQF
jgi:hypothetical protein